MTDRTFETFDLQNNVTDLSHGLLLEMAEALRFDIGENPDQQKLYEFAGHIGPAKELQDNIAIVQKILGSDRDATSIAADWLERSGMMQPLDRPFVEPGIDRPEKIDTVMFSGGVANWILRRTSVVEWLNPENVGQVIIPAGERQMGNGEHQLVATLNRYMLEQHGGNASPITETEFAYAIAADRLETAGFDVDLHHFASSNGDEILSDTFAKRPELLSGNILIAGNAPNAIQAAGQIRLAALKADKTFDSNGDQLFMLSDSVPIARRGEGKNTHQNPFSALGQIARNAQIIVRNQEDKQPAGY